MYAPPPIANLLVLRSPDIHRAAEFYRALGLLFTLERHEGGPEHYSSRVNGFVLEIYPLAEGRTPTTTVRIGFSVDSVDELVSLVRVKGAEACRRALLGEPVRNQVNAPVVASQFS